MSKATDTAKDKVKASSVVAKDKVKASASAARGKLKSSSATAKRVIERKEGVTKERASNVMAKVGRNQYGAKKGADSSEKGKRKYA